MSCLWTVWYLRMVFCTRIGMEAGSWLVEVRVTVILSLSSHSVFCWWFFSVKVIKLVSTIFYQIFIFLPNDSSSKTIKNVFLFHLKSFFRYWDIQIFVFRSSPFFFSLSTIALEVDPRKILKFMTSSTVYIRT